MTHQPGKILIVEDEPDAARLVEFHLRRRGFIPVTAGDGEKALEAVRREQPDLIILDVLLPRLSGWEVCSQLKLEPETAGIPVLLLTAMASVDDKLQGFGCGADDYLTKPYNVAELIVRVYALLRRGTRPAVGTVCDGATLDFSR